MTLFCFQPTFTVKRHIFLSFGSIAAIAMTIVVSLAAGFSSRAGNIVKDNAKEMMNRELIISIQDSSRLTSDVYTAKLITLRGLAALMAEVVRDRIVGYPDDNFEDDRHVPFEDWDTGMNMYPLATPQLPLDWNISLNLLNQEGIVEHIEGYRANYFTERSMLSRLSTATPSFFIPGACNPSSTDKNDLGFLSGCVEENNNLEAAAGTTQGLAEKAADIGLLLKPLWETTSEALTLNVYFHNSGRGAEVSFPGIIKDSEDTYVSAGCAWMRKTNPYTGLPFGTEEEISGCHPKGERVSYRQMNPMEHGFCEDQALHPEETRVFGPYYSEEYEDFLLLVGMAIFDRRTGNFIGCIGVTTSVSAFQEVLDDSIVGEYTQAALISGEGTMIAGGGWNADEHTEPLHISETEFVDLKTIQSFASSVDWDTTWNPTEVEAVFAQSAIEFKDRLLTAYPIPAIPENYDPNYLPEMYAVFSIGGEAFQVVGDIENEIDDEVRRLIRFSVLVAALGLTLLLGFVWLVATMLTTPLNWIKQVSQKMVGDDNSVPSEVALFQSCNTRTEIQDLVEEFESMLNGFSGEGAAYVVPSPQKETENTVKWKEELSSLYSGRRSSLSNGKLVLQGNPQAAGIAEDERDGNTSVENKTNKGSNLPLKDGAVKGNDLERHLASRSKLFTAIVCLISTPLILASAVICAVVSIEISATLPGLVDVSEDLEFQVKLDSLSSAAQLRALYSAEIFRESLRNVVFVQRVAGWLVFDGISRSDAFVSSEIESIDECKSYAPDGSCPFLQDKTRASCDCKWKDSRAGNGCYEYDVDSRYYQKMLLIANRMPGDTDPLTGNHNTSTSFPGHSYSPETTFWWNDTEIMPGVEKGLNASGYETIYDRFRVMSATAVAHLPIYNYVNTANNVNDRLVYGTYIALEDDGILFGYGGCRWDLHHLARYTVAPQNSGGVNRPELCPVGKAGYDVRCRPPYAANKNATAPVKITPPYPASDDDDGVSGAGSHLVDPKNGQYIGQIIVDFAPADLMDTLRSRTGSHFYFLISPDSLNDENTVTATNYTFSGKPEKIEDVALPYDDIDSPNRVAFSAIVDDMESGGTGEASVTRRLEDGSEELLRLSYAPVYGRFLEPGHEDFSRGSKVSEAVMYSLGIMRLEEVMKETFTSMKADSDESIDLITWLFPLLVAGVVCVSLLATVLVSHIISYPIVELLYMVRDFNDGNIRDEPPHKLSSPSSEETEIFEAFSKLHEVVRVASKTAFSGDMERAFDTTNRAHELFLRVNDDKACGIASNNLGVAVLTIFRQHYMRRGTCYKVNGSCCADMAKFYFDDAVRKAEAQHERILSDPKKTPTEEASLYKQQLANRYFNRAMFYFVCESDPCCPKISRELGLKDLRATKRLDDVVRGEWQKADALVSRSDLYFDRLVRRINGLAVIRRHNSDVWEDGWNVHDVVAEAVKMLQSVWNVPDAAMFDEVSRVGRVQQLEAAYTMAMLACRQGEEAAQMAVRMIVEDEYILDSAFAPTMEAVSLDIRKNPSKWSPPAVDSFRSQLLSIAERNGVQGTFSSHKRVFFCAELGEEKGWGSRMTESLRTYLLRLYDDYCAPDDDVGVATYSVKSGHPLFSNIFRKETHATEHREVLSGLSPEQPSSENCRSLVLGIQASMEATLMESFVILVTDGSGWDKQYKSFLGSRRSMISRQNKELGASQALHVIIVGLELKSTELINAFKSITDVCSSKSVFLNVTRSEVGSAFEEVGHRLSNDDEHMSHMLQLSTTWEKL